MLPPPPRSTLFPYTTLFRSGLQGEVGNGISAIALTKTEGLVDTYTITYTDGTTSTFTLTNGDRKSTRLNSSHVRISYAVFCLKKKTKIETKIKIRAYTKNSS